MSSYKWNVWFIISCVATTTIGLSIGLDQHYLKKSFRDDYKLNQVLPVSRGRVVNVTDVVYKSALRFLRCSAVPDNPHGISLLDPLDFSLNIQVHRDTIRLNGTISGVATGLSKLTINHVNVAISSASAKFVGVLPRLSISGTYDVSGALVDTLPVYGSGPFSIEVSNIILTVTAVLGVKDKNKIFMSNFSVEFYPDSVKLSLGAILGGGPLGSLLQDFLQDAALELLARARPLIQEDLRNTVVAAANKRLANVAGFNALVKFFVVFGNVTDSC